MQKALTRGLNIYVRAPPAPTPGPKHVYIPPSAPSSLVDLEDRVALASRSTQEVLTPEELRGVFETHRARPGPTSGSSPPDASPSVTWSPPARCATSRRRAASSPSSSRTGTPGSTTSSGDPWSGSGPPASTCVRRSRPSGVDPAKAQVPLGLGAAPGLEYWARVVRVAKVDHPRPDEAGDDDHGPGRGGGEPGHGQAVLPGDAGRGHLRAPRRDRLRRDRPAPGPRPRPGDGPPLRLARPPRRPHARSSRR